MSRTHDSHDPDLDPQVAAIEAEISATRDRLGETVEALTAKLNVKQRAQNRARHTASDVGDRIKAEVAHVRRNPRAAVPWILAIGLAIATGIVSSRETD